MQGLRAFQRYFDFSGRSARAEYWQFFGICFAVLFAALALDFALGNYDTNVLTDLSLFALAVPFCAATTRRLHDREQTGWMVGILVALAIVRIVLIYQAGRYTYTATGDVLRAMLKVTQYGGMGLEAVVFLQLIRKGTDGVNKFGPPPSAIDAPPPTVEQLVGRLKQLGSPSTAATAGPVPAADPLQQIARLAELRDTGALTEAEFAERKATLLGRL